MLVDQTNSIRPTANRRRRRENGYRLRMMTALAVSLVTVTVAVRLPIESRELKVGWDPPPTSERIEFSVDRSVQATRTGGSSAPSVGLPTPQRATQPEENGGNSGNRDEPDQSVVRPMQARETVYEFVENPPAIRGGMGAYYIHIEYPPEAVVREIEGRLVLRFVVGTDGKAREIAVAKSLHPLCDSAAVRALRRTTFVPGRLDGKKVSVRMQLPVRFRLVGPGQKDSETP